MSDAEAYEDYCESVLKNLTSVLSVEQINRSKAFRHLAIFKRSGFADLASVQGLTRFGVTELSNKEVADLRNHIPQTAKTISDAVYKVEEAYIAAVFKTHPRCSGKQLGSTESCPVQHLPSKFFFIRVDHGF